ncbi:MAG: hypothetical protein M3Q71_07805, partial [Chloroflexota bacterium]|nr:hypothetical protein [Chloroflexota bacterium]
PPSPLAAQAVTPRSRSRDTARCAPSAPERFSVAPNHSQYLALALPPLVEITPILSIAPSP